MVDALGWAAFLAALVGTLVLMSELGYRAGLRAAWFVATLAVPFWFDTSFRSVGLDAVTGVSLAMLAASALRPFAGRATPWVASDLAILAIVLSGIVSDAANRMLIPGTVVELTRTWVLPYLLGRLCVESWDEMKRSLPLIVVLATILAGYCIAEALFRFNALAYLSGRKWALLERGEGFRWGLKRAQGITNHPIYLGLLLSLVLPWLLVAARAAGHGVAPRWWKLAPLLAIAAAFLSVSRSAHLAIIVVLVADVFFRKPGWRVPMIVGAAIGGLFLLAFREQVIDLMGAYAGEAAVGEDRVRINGVEYDYTGTRHRDLLLLAYEDAIQSAGWFGYGTTLPAMPRDPAMDARFHSIDHHYLLHYLRYGYLGIATFAALVVTGVWNLGREAVRRAGPGSDLAGGLCGAFVGVAVLVRGVALPFDVAAMWLFVAGLGASFHARRLASIPATPNMMAGAAGEEPGQ